MNSRLQASKFIPLKMNEIKPQGWILNQLQIQAAGLSGNLDKFWPDIKDSEWIGGKAEGWERVPYWLDGFIPLAWALNDEDMKTRASFYINFIIKHQSEDGWICPSDNKDRDKYDLWALFLILKVLVLYHDATGDERIEIVVKKALCALDKHIDKHTLFNWAQFRWFESLISIWWLYERVKEEWLISLASKLHSQGFDWVSFFKEWPYKKPEEKGRWSQMSHVVNNAMMLKGETLWSKLKGATENKNSTEEIVGILDKYHGMVTGVFTGDECLSGTSPVQGTELCAVAEYMYSLEHLISITGNANWGDRLERIAFNALPATFSPDMWTHQYDQQVNQVQCSFQKVPLYGTNRGDSNLFGLEPNFGCCTSNLSQAWPKLALSSIMRSEVGFAVSVYTPCLVNTVFKGVNVTIQLDTNYPFSEIINLKIKVSSPVAFALELRIPEWAENPHLTLNGTKIPVKAGSFHQLMHSWTAETNVTLQLPMKLKLEPRPNNLFVVTRGPLIYSLAIAEKWVQVNKDIPGREHPHCDYEVLPTTAWNYGLCIDKNNLAGSLKFENHDVGTLPFSPTGAPTMIRVKGRKVNWDMVHGSATPVPKLDWVSDEIEDLVLIPYGCSNIRLTEMPLV